MKNRAAHVYQFGPYRLDSSERLLLRGGELVPLPPKAFDTLLLLVERNGHLLRKEELLAALWPDTFVEENNLTQSISAVRKALDEGHHESSYIETVPRLGYRFVAPVEEIGSEEEQLTLARRTRAHIVIREEEEELETSTSEVATTPGFDAEQGLPSPAIRIGGPAKVRGAAVSQAKKWKWFAAAGAVATLLVAAFLYLRPGQKMTERDSILVADFVNSTGEPVFEGTLKQALAVKLEESPFLDVLPEQRVRETLRFMGRSADERLTAPLAQEVCERRGIKAMLMGSIERLGSHYIIALEAVNCSTGDSLAREQVEADSKEQVLQAVGKAASRVRQKLGESLSSVQKFDAPIEEATTSSLEALKAFSLGEARRAKGAHVDAAPFYERAVELDPKFALAYGRLGAIYENAGESKRAIEYKKKAFELRERVSEREKLYITGHYYATVTGEIDKAAAAYEMWKQTYPRDFIPYINLAAEYNIAGQFEQALKEGREGLRLNPGHALAYNACGWAYLGLNRFAEAKAIFEQAIAHKLEYPNIHRGLYVVGLIQGDAAGMQRQADWNKGKVDEYRMFNLQAQVEALSGRLPRARERYGWSVALAQRNNFKDNAAGIAAGAALVEANFGNYRRAREGVGRAMAITHGREALGIGATALALSGEARQAQEFIEELATGYPTDTLVNAVALPTARAALELHRGNPAKSIELLQAAIPYELGPFVFSQGYMPIYLRGQAYLRAGKGVEAAAEFQKILDHRGAAPISPLYALAHLGLARAYLLNRDTAKSQRAYQDFLALWKDADSDVPALRQARAEYAKLK